MVPQISQLPIHAVWCASRPLVVYKDGEDPTQITRSFECIDHAVDGGVDGFVSVLGGKATTMRAMAEKTADMICAKTGRSIPCRTRETVLTHYRGLFRTRPFV